MTTIPLYKLRVNEVTATTLYSRAEGVDGRTRLAYAMYSPTETSMLLTDEAIATLMLRLDRDIKEAGEYSKILSDAYAALAKAYANGAVKHI